MGAEKLYWIVNGELVESLDNLGLEAVDEGMLLDRHGMVRLRISEKGTEVRWSVFSGNWASLFHVMDWLQHQPTPITLQYYLVGWFVETLADPFSARERIHRIMAKSDVHLTARTLVKQVNPKNFEIPDLLGDAIAHRDVSEDHSIDCKFDEDENRFKVVRIGSNSMIASLWGVEPVSYPCINGGSYDQIVSAVYPEVIRSGHPEYGHVYAAMNFPQSPVRWFPYQRVILPKKFANGDLGVTVVSKAEPVDIEVM